MHGSPGKGVTGPYLSREPLATEGEATPGPDDVNPYAMLEDREQKQKFEAELRREQETVPSLPDFGGDRKPEKKPLFSTEFSLPDF